MGIAEFIGTTKGKIIIAVVIIIILALIWWMYYYKTSTFTNRYYYNNISPFAGDSAYRFRDQNLIPY